MYGIPSVFFPRALICAAAWACQDRVTALHVHTPFRSLSLMCLVIQVSTLIQFFWQDDCVVVSMFLCAPLDVMLGVDSDDQSGHLISLRWLENVID